jgi:hypothetical protein
MKKKVVFMSILVAIVTMISLNVSISKDENGKKDLSLKEVTASAGTMYGDQWMQVYDYPVDDWCCVFAPISQCGSNWFCY